MPLSSPPAGGVQATLLSFIAFIKNASDKRSNTHTTLGGEFTRQTGFLKDIKRGLASLVYRRPIVSASDKM